MLTWFFSLVILSLIYQVNSSFHSDAITDLNGVFLDVFKALEYFRDLDYPKDLYLVPYGFEFI